jgi:hypothetical protein
MVRMNAFGIGMTKGMDDGMVPFLKGAGNE